MKTFTLWLKQRLLNPTWEQAEQYFTVVVVMAVVTALLCLWMKLR